ncbi:hypothetical protein CFC21_032741 [Triticum aestivum]|nr:uncharacterized protein LOC109769576 [Aegilops tauschii subsp. strangulata]XP_044329309.1 uncharacterized protein LOC123050606 [Triticum aestivum]KAF7019581.1 hypothetical protein CFC21_032741 [Triticum aestivum]
MRLQTQLLILASITAAMIMSHDVLAGTTHAIPVRTLGGVEEDDVGFAEREEEAYPRRRVLYGDQYISYKGVQASRPACPGSCAGRGQPYTGSGCQAIFGCRGR